MMKSHGKCSFYRPAQFFGGMEEKRYYKHRCGYWLSLILDARRCRGIIRNINHEAPASARLLPELKRDPKEKRISRTEKKRAAVSTAETENNNLRPSTVLFLTTPQSPKRPFNHKQDQERKKEDTYTEKKKKKRKKKEKVAKKTLHLAFSLSLLLCVNRVKSKAKKSSLSTILLLFSEE
ncbi:hypothetical protein CEXT_121401 [Caerostris extrusa]|uniref:Uncharacterized protein n=1 Tax=Caerostris extrusa TaxID=172846 RepID=A0AAV4RK18_CAEEX|nr:hypothetical protein CEXT_121401 [Caerostris extrusa]